MQTAGQPAYGIRSVQHQAQLQAMTQAAQQQTTTTCFSMMYSCCQHWASSTTGGVCMWLPCSSQQLHNPVGSVKHRFTMACCWPQLSSRC